MIRRQVFGGAVLIGIVLGVTINAYNLTHPETFQSEFVYFAEAEEPQVIQIATKIDWTPARIEREIEEQAEKYGRNATYMKKLIQCESMGSTTIQSTHRYGFTDARLGIYEGERERSFGLAQIHLPHHPTVSEEEAKDPAFAIAWMAKNLANTKWYCEDMI